MQGALRTVGEFSRRNGLPSAEGSSTRSVEFPGARTVSSRVSVSRARWSTSAIPVTADHLLALAYVGAGDDAVGGVEVGGDGEGVLPTPCIGRSRSPVAHADRLTPAVGGQGGNANGTHHRPPDFLGVPAGDGRDDAERIGCRDRERDGLVRPAPTQIGIIELIAQRFECFELGERGGHVQPDPPRRSGPIVLDRFCIISGARSMNSARPAFVGHQRLSESVQVLGHHAHVAPCCRTKSLI